MKMILNNKKKNMKNKKLGFTLGEVLIALGIVGVCTVVMLSTMKPVDNKTTRYLYINAYNSLSKAYYNSMLDGYNPFTTQEFNGIEPEHTDTKDTGTEILCKGLTDYINTVSSSCSATKLTSLKGDSFTDDNVQFTATNGTKFYITKLFKGEDIPLPFYIVFIDINGTRFPNTMEYTFKSGGNSSKSAGKKGTDIIEPDIYAFAMLDSGRICPIGIPEYDTDVLTARFAYYGSDGDTLYTKKSLAYYQAKGAAWGYYSSITTKEKLLDYNPDEIFSMNDIIRDEIKGIESESKIIKDFPDLSKLTPTNLSSGDPYHCNEGDLESCYIFLDQYRQ